MRSCLPIALHPVQAETRLRISFNAIHVNKTILNIVFVQQFIQDIELRLNLMSQSTIFKSCQDSSKGEGSKRMEQTEKAPTPAKFACHPAIRLNITGTYL